MQHPTSPAPAIDADPPQLSRDAVGEARTPARPARVRSALRAGTRAGLSAAGSAILTGGLLAALLVGGLFIGPTVGMAAVDTSAPPSRPPIIPPAVPLGAREDWAVWSYVDKINQAWGKDWPKAIEWFEDLDARYPHNPMVFDKLYAAYIEDGRTLQAKGDLAGARVRYEQAAQWDPDRGVAQAFLSDLDKLQSSRR